MSKLAYGLWVTDDPKIVIFDRGYQPFLIVEENGKAKDCENHWIEGIAIQVIFWFDTTPQEQREQISNSILKIMRENVYRA